MKSLSVKEYLSLKMPTEEAPVRDQSRILLALDALGYEHVTIPLHILRMLYPMCRDANWVTYWHPIAKRFQCSQNTDLQLTAVYSVSTFGLRYSLTLKLFIACTSIFLYYSILSSKWV